MDSQRLRELQTMDYTQYLLTPEWKAKRRQALERDGYRCRVCNSNKSLEVHHRSYQNRGNEDIEADLTTLCDPCHEKFHDRIQQNLAREGTNEFLPPEHESGIQKWEYYLLGMLLQNPDLIRHVCGIISEDDFENVEIKTLYVFINASLFAGQSFTEQDIPLELQETAADATKTLGMDKHLDSGIELIKRAIQASTRIKRARLSRTNSELDVQIRAATDAKDTEALLPLLQKKQQNSMLMRTIHSGVRLGE